MKTKRWYLLNKEKNEKINEIMLHSLSGGKRIRPIICYLVFKHLRMVIHQENDFKNIIYSRNNS